MIKDISSALEYIHEKDCLHRDIKPDNILVSSQSFCLTDFGMASFSTGNRKTESLPVKRGHTWQYAAPEVLRKNGNETFAVDIFSFGVMILECLTDLPLVATPGTSDTPGPSAAKDTAERTLDVHKGYRERLEQAWPAAVSMLSDAPSKRPGANRIYEDLEKSGGVPLASNVSLGDSGRELRSHKRRLASEQGIPAQGPDPDAMSWTASLAERLAQRPADWRAREEKNAKRQRDRQSARRIKKK
jgi:serine/threonine protein kinase